MRFLFVSVYTLCSRTVQCGKAELLFFLSERARANLNAGMRTLARSRKDTGYSEPGPSAE
jgi:hypothetical protein